MLINSSYNGTSLTEPSCDAVTYYMFFLSAPPQIAFAWCTAPEDA